MRSVRLALVLALAGGAVAVGVPAQAADPPGTVAISDAASHQLTGVVLSPGRVTWLDSSPKDNPLYKRAVRLDGSTITLGPTALIGSTAPKLHGACCGDTTFVEGYPFSASGARTGWTTETNATYYSNGSTVSTVTTGGRLSTGTALAKSFAAPSEVLRVSGTRVLYRTRTGYQLYDLRTHVTTNLTTTFGGAAQRLLAVDLFGDSLFFARTDGSIWRKTLGAQVASVQVVGPGPSQGVHVFAWGDWVGWSRHTVSTTDCGIRQAGHAAVALVDCPTALTDAGAILQDQDTKAWTLRHYAGDVVDLPVPSTATQVSIDGGLLAWIQADGVGRLAPLPNAPDTAPRYLGNAIAPTTYKRTGPSWTLDLVASAALAKCSVDIKKVNGPTVRTLPCSAGLLPAGEVQAHWDGKNGSGVKVPTGSYQWIVTAADAQFDDLQDTNGLPAQITGKIMVS